MVYTVTTLPLACDISRISHKVAMGFYTQKKRTRWSSLLFIDLHFFTVFFLGGGGGAYFVFIYRDVYEFIVLCMSIQSTSAVNFADCFR